MIIDKRFAKQSEDIAGNIDPDLSYINNPIRFVYSFSP